MSSAKETELPQESDSSNSSGEHDHEKTGAEEVKICDQVLEEEESNALQDPESEIHETEEDSSKSCDEYSVPSHENLIEEENSGVASANVGSNIPENQVQQPGIRFFDPPKKKNLILFLNSILNKVQMTL